MPAIELQSLINPRVTEVRDKRRLIKGLTATNSPPTNSPEADVTKGTSVRHHRFLHLVFKSSTGTSFVARLWGKSDFSNYWAPINWFGTLGSITVVTATDGGLSMPQPLEIDGIDEIFIEIVTVTGGGEIVEVWAAGNTF